MTPRRLRDSIALVTWILAILALSWLPGQGDFHIILPALVAAFGSYIYLSFYSKTPIKWLLLAAIMVRIAIIPAFPNLSDDIYRFIWDGRLWHHDMNAYMALPSEIVGQHIAFSNELYDRLNSQNYFSIYPPVAQFIFWISTFAESSGLWQEAFIMKCIHCAFDLGSLLLIWRLLGHFGIDQRRITLYALNPLIIVELIGNLHHEGIVIFFLLLMLWFILQKKHTWAGVAMGGAIATKILPLLFCPLLFFYLKGKQRWAFTVATLATSLVLFSPVLFHPEIIHNISNSADLYLRKFEFNASFYYLYRAFGYLIYGYNTIHFIGPILMVGALLGVFYIALIRRHKETTVRQLIILLMMTYGCYVFLSITVHPWYIAVLIPLCLFTPYRTPILWSGLIMLTYINYSLQPYQEALWVVGIEYVAVISLFIFEIKRHGMSLS